MRALEALGDAVPAPLDRYPDERLEEGDASRSALFLENTAAYPENVDEPVIRTDSFSYNPFLYFRTVPLPGNPENLDLEMMRDFIDDEVRPPMERVEGVSRVRLSGGAPRQIRIEVDPTRLAERDLSLPAVIALLVVATALPGAEIPESGAALEGAAAETFLASAEVVDLDADVTRHRVVRICPS